MPFHGSLNGIKDLDDIKDIGYVPLTPYLRDWIEQEFKNLDSEQYNISEDEFINLLEGK